MSLMKLRHRGPGSGGDGGTPVDPPADIVNALGLNINPPSYYHAHPVYANLALYSSWMITGGAEADPARVDAMGNLLAMASGVGLYTKIMPRTGIGKKYYRATWDGAGRISTVSSVGGHFPPTFSPNNTTNRVEWSTDWTGIDENTRVSNFFVNWAYTAEAEPVMNLEIREIDGFDGDILQPGRFYDSYIERFRDWGVTRGRFLGWTASNSYNSNGASSFIPINWADRTPAGARTISRAMVAATAATGAGTSALSFAANIALSGGTAGTIVNLLTSYPLAAIGKAGNAVTINYGGSAATGGVVVSGPPEAISVDVTMFSGETTADQFKALWASSGTFTGYVDGTTLYVKTVASGKRLGIGFGFHVDTVGGPYAGIDMRTRIVSQLSGTPGGVGTYQIDRAGSFASDAAPVTFTFASLAQYLAIVTSGGSGAVAPFAGLQLQNGHDPVSTTGFPIEDLVALCNAANMDLHLTIPIGVSDDYVQGLCEYCAANLVCTLIVEWDNEVWNKVLPYVQGMLWCSAMAIASNTVPVTAQTWFDPTYGYAMRWRQIMAIAKTAYAAHPEKLGRALTCIQHTVPSTAKGFFNSSDTRYCANQSDEALTSIYTFNNVFPVGGNNPNSLGGLPKYKGLLTNGVALQQYDYGYYGDAATGKGWFASEAHTMSTDNPADDPLMTEMTMTAYLDPYYSDMETRLTQAGVVRDMAAAVINDRGNPVRYGNYEGGGGQAEIARLATGDGATIMLRTIVEMYTGDAMKAAESHFWRRYLEALPGAVMDITNEESTELVLNQNYGLETTSWAPDSLSPRRVAFKGAAHGIFYDS